MYTLIILSIFYTGTSVESFRGRFDNVEQCRAEGMRILQEDVRIVPPSKKIMVGFACNRKDEA